MGWNSWNYFKCEGLNEKVVREIADAMVSSGMKDAGYEYIVIDDCWQIARDANGEIIADPDKFPSGIEALADYIHSKGLKFGIYSCAGTQTCQERPGSRGHEFQDARTYARWGVDFLKYDWCHAGTQDAVASYTLMRDALYAAGRPIVFSICEWGVSKPWEWAQDVGHLYRTCGDIRNNWDIPDVKGGKIWAGGFILNLDVQTGLHDFSGPDHWADPDMLQIGNGGLTEEECRTHFSLWAMLAAPLFAGNDLRNMSAETIAILTNEEIIAIDQDPLGITGHKVIDEWEFEVFEKKLANGAVAYCFFNRKRERVSMTFDWDTIEVGDGYQIRDLWKFENIGTTAEPIELEIPGHGVVHVKLTPDG
jgi:alpha-galactosidase